MRRRLILLLLVVGFSVEAGMTNVFQETFEGIGTLNSGTPGNLGLVSGAFYKRAVGPRINGMAAPGWSAQIRSNAWHEWITETSSIADRGFVGGWFLVRSASVPAGHLSTFMRAVNNHPAAILTCAVGISSEAKLAVSAYNAPQTNVWSFPLNQWFFVGLAYQVGGPYMWDFTNQVYVKLVGEPMIKVHEYVVTVWTGTISNIVAGACPVWGGETWVGRYGCPSAYAIGSLADVEYPSDIVEPSNEPVTWYVNGSIGSDTNTGLAGFPWKTVGLLNDELDYSGVIASSKAFGIGGNTVIIDNSPAPFDVGTNVLGLHTSGTKYVFTNGPIKVHADLSPTNWVKTAGWANIYETTDNNASDLQSVVIWEDNKWLDHPTGANFAAVAAALDANAGSFYSDGTKLFLHTLDSSDPSANGRSYTRSRFRGGVGLSAIEVWGKDVWVDGLVCSKTALAKLTDNDPWNGYAIQWDSAGGSNRMSNFSIDYFSKHGAGWTFAASNGYLERTNGIYGQGTPYASYGGQTADVDFGTLGTNNSWAYLNCTQNVNAGVKGSTEGTFNGAYASWISHGDPLQFAGGIFQNCSFVGRCDELGDSSKIVFSNSRVAHVDAYCDVDFLQSRCVGGMVPIVNTVTANSKTLTLRNSLIAPTFSVVGGELAWGLCAGTGIVENCTFDFTGSPSTFGNCWVRNGASSWVFRNNVVKVGSGQDIAVWSGLSASDVLVASNNVYQLGSRAILVRSYNGVTNLTLAGCQALRLDTRSKAVIDARLDPEYKPYGDSPVIGAITASIGQDLTGHLYGNRRTAGAYEYRYRGGSNGFRP